jgi:5-carboxymethyl-2-hydroxymuconate isomerase
MLNTGRQRREELMPHITIEYSANVAEHHNIGILVDAVHAAALAHGLPPADGLRTRAACRDHYRIANGDPLHAFVAVHVRIGPGRDLETQQGFIETVLDAAEAQVVSEGGPLAIAWSIELNEINPSLRINHNHVRTRMNEQQGSN